MALPTLELISAEKELLQEKVGDLGTQIAIMEKELDECNSELYSLKLKEIHIAEIERLATIQFSRFRKEPGLTDADIKELEKWIGRCKNIDSYKDIIDAVKELKKYKKGQIKNLYALVQKIIIEGAYRGKRKK